MFFRKLSQSGNSSSNPPEYTENDYLNHKPFFSSLRTSALGPQIAPLNEVNPSKGKTVLKTLKDVQKLGNVPFHYNVFDEALNPPTPLHDCKSLRLELALDTDTVYLPGLFEQQGSSSDCPLALLTGKVIVTVKATYNLCDARLQD
ncbi:uncharacterized protein KLLA0_B10406g [Kluyveromyces lactis]|uniref:KLLA0B10406p n=1 Tax=Kluyveromyces lactis (strain ATCC 8585 / CBS 2359 / DSM 70799 / NBRC 1267 / NRRL Y-1140 / WM37) TaxID=284590 RepID=Q6CVP6_KLULA|nr:uncharacterized protein KLLA0_B10406g [Kluyveromyces lactis]CAH02386.1 KLLA0B10406p [Kluyveromyces lactis]|eukprot:XP_451993.1 uncharacterized protein KLLA0_B10406g [Kluyveromyces lactis]